MTLIRTWSSAILGIAMVVSAASPAVAEPGRVDVHTPAAELRVSLGRLFAEHTFLVMEEMRAGARAAPDFKESAVAVEANTQDLKGLIAQVYGAPAGEGFADLWRSHIGYIVDYAIANTKKDDAGKQRALAQLAKYKDDQAAFLAAANPSLSAVAEAETLERHIEHFIAFSTDDHPKAYAIQRQAYAHMFTLGDHLSDALIKQFPNTFTGQKAAFSPAVSLRVNMGRTLGEHAVLAMEAMRATLTKANDRTAIVAALDGNSTDLRSWISQIYGEAGATRFDTLWRSHVRAYLEYVDAVAAKDDAGKRKALDSLGVYQRDFSAFLAAANPHLTQPGVEALLAEHLRGLAGQVDAYAAGDYTKTYTLVRGAYAHMFMIGDGLATAIAAQFPNEFPPELPNTATAPAEVPLGVLLMAAGLAFLAWRPARPTAALAQRHATREDGRRRRLP